MIEIIDYGIGNLRSVLNAFAVAGLPARINHDPKNLRDASRALLPGVGAFGAASEALAKSGFDDALREFVARERPLLGICLGMQLLADEGEEFGRHEGLGFVPGSVRRIPQEPIGVRLPHIGWNSIDPVEGASLFAGLGADRCAYFAHSFALAPKNISHIAATTEYGSRVVAAVGKDNVYGVQFHPEKSQLVGQIVLSNFARL